MCFVLVAYATRHGSTSSIAQRITDRLTEHGHRVELRDVGGIGNVWQYDAALVGSAIHNGDWLPESAEFLHRYARPLADRPLWLFSVGFTPQVAGRRGRWLARHTPDPRAIEVDRDFLTPRDVHWFAGVLTPSHIPLRAWPLLWMVGGRFGDRRDWDAVDTWANGIAEKLDVLDADLGADTE
ncbi:MAG: flavodoxin [Saccharothrix sp.]|nr:flavodoxin [Saccharothrix sp.]